MRTPKRGHACLILTLLVSASLIHSGEALEPPKHPAYELAMAELRPANATAGNTPEVKPREGVKELAVEAPATGKGDLSEPGQLPSETKDLPRGWRSETRTIPVKAPASEQLEPKAITCYVNELGMDFVLVRPGEFMMGSPRGEPGREVGESPQHQVRITRGFYIGAHEVTQEQYAKVMGKNPSKRLGARNPVERVSWDDAVEFCARLSKEGCTYRLPTEAEWEYACRSGSTAAYCSGDDPRELEKYAWYESNSGEQTHEVGVKQPNAWGLYDVHGNVWEWCQDWYGDYARGPIEDPVGPTSGTYRVVRGGSWFDYPVPLRCASRGRDSPSNRPDDHGFRVVCAPKP
jgi:formylglycine-generating enzyme required for sulfatase activity